jgi:hypothetical protein
VKAIPIAAAFSSKRTEGCGVGVGGGGAAACFSGARRQAGRRRERTRRRRSAALIRVVSDDPLTLPLSPRGERELAGQ